MAVAGQTHNASSPPGVALVAAVNGEVRARGSAERRLELRGWLATRETIVLEPQALVVVIYRSGRRFEVRGPAEVSVGLKSLKLGRRCRELESLPPWPTLPSLDAAEVRATEAAATRIRTQEITGMAPARDERVLPDRVVLRFDAERGASRYAVRLFDATGQTALETETHGTVVKVPEALLSFGTPYSWSVETLDHMGPPAQGWASFRTLDEATFGARARVEAQASATPDAQHYLAELDAALGLAGQTAAAPSSAR